MQDKTNKPLPNKSRKSMQQLADIKSNKLSTAYDSQSYQTSFNTNQH